MLCRACYSPPFGLRSTGRLTRYVFKCISVLAVHVNAKLAFVSPRDHFHPSTAVIAPLSSPRCCYRQRPRHALCTKSTLYTIEIAVPFKMSVRLLHFPLCSFFSYPPPIHLRRLLSLRSTPTAHLRNMWGGVSCTGPSQDYFPSGNIIRIYVRCKNGDVQSMSPEVSLCASIYTHHQPHRVRHILNYGTTA